MPQIAGNRGKYLKIFLGVAPHIPPVGGVTLPTPSPASQDKV